MGTALVTQNIPQPGLGVRHAHSLQHGLLCWRLPKSMGTMQTWQSLEKHPRPAKSLFVKEKKKKIGTGNALCEATGLGMMLSMQQTSSRSGQIHLH